MKERITFLKNAYFRNVLNVIEQLLKEVPQPVYELPKRSSITKYYLTDLVRKDSLDEKRGKISMNYYTSTFTQYGAIVGGRPEKEPLIFECYQKDENIAVELRGYHSTNKESRIWIKYIFEDIWSELLERFSS